MAMGKKVTDRLKQRQMLDYSGFMSLANQPKKPEEFNALFNLFKEKNPEAYKESHDIIFLRKKPEAGNMEGMVASKVSEIVEANLEIQSSSAINQIREKFKGVIESAEEKISQKAHKEIEKARGEFVTINVKSKTGKSVSMKGDILPEQFAQLLQLAQERVNILMVGPAGCGKTHVASLIAKALDLPFGTQSCSAGVSESVFTGWLLPTGSNAKFSHVASEFLNMYENGGVFLLDEIDASDPNVLVFINQALANDSFMVPQRFDKPLFKKHKDFVAVAAANTHGHGADEMYHGRNSLDAATLDRFKIGTINMDYSDMVENAIIDEEILTWGREVRSKIKNHGLRKIMSTRVMKDATKMKAGQGWELRQIADSYFSDWSKEEMAIMGAA